ncbi:MAG: HAD family phosphatase [Firmicutes bacterium]|nr:HAD family phosphatase [Bacillota bacterium]
MIKLIACDLDGTLLPDSKMLPLEMPLILKELKARNINFVPASGRQIWSMKMLFDPLDDGLALICENGALITLGNKELFSGVMDKELVKTLAKEALKIKDMEILLCGKYEAYTNLASTADFLCAPKFGYKVKVVKDILSVNEDIIKVSMVHDKNIMELGFEPLSPKYSNVCEVELSGHGCLDFMNKGVNKGNALRILREHFGIDKDDCASFGDNFNDATMFSQAKYSFAMGSAPQAVKESAAFVTGDCNEGAVLKEIKKLCGI